MKNNWKCYFLSRIVAAVVIATVMPVPACSGGATTQKDSSISDGSTQDAEHNIKSDALVICPELRPQICTQEYRPVCARMKDGRFKTYSNGCTSCTDPNVVGYRDGDCDATQ